MLFDGLRPTILPLPRHPGTAGRLRPGQSLQGRVEGTSGKLYVQVAGTRVPIASEGALQPGQLVRLTVVQGENGLALHLTPQPPGGSAAPTIDAALKELLALVLNRLGTGQSSEIARPLVPAFLPRTSEALEHLLGLFTTRQQLGPDVGALAALLSRAAGAGALPRQQAEAFAALVASFTAGETENWKALLQRLGKGDTEARLAAALKKGALDTVLAELHASLRAQVARLRGNDALLAWLRGQQQIDRFETLADRIMARLSGGQLQNLRGLEQPYLFLEIPLPEQSGFNHVQVHFFDEGRKQEAAFDKYNATVVMDVSTHHLGELWVMVRILSGNCQCTFRATSASAREAIEAASGELAAGLAHAGYDNARVETVPWDGDRFSAAVQLMQRFTELNLNA